MADETFAVELTAGAEDDLETIYAYIAAHRSRDDADRLLDAFLDKVQALERFLDRGSIPKELERLGITDFRQTLLLPYRLIYRVIETTVTILVIADGRRDMQALLERRLLGRGLA